MTTEAPTIFDAEPSEAEMIDALITTPETDDDSTEDELPPMETADADEEADEATPDADEADEGEEESADEEDEDDEAEDEAEEPKEGELHTVTVDGKEVQVTLEEALRDYSGQAAIKARFQEFGREREAFVRERNEHSEQVQQLQAQRTQLGQLLQHISQVGVQMQPPVLPQQSDYVGDPMGYSQAMAQFTAEQHTYAQQQGMIQQQIQHGQEEAKRSRDALLAEQRDELAREFPEFADNNTRPAFLGRLRATAESFGFTQEELGQVADARVIKLLHAAAGQQETKKAAKKMVEAPAAKTLKKKPGSRGPAKAKRKAATLLETMRGADPARAEDASVDYLLTP